MANQTQATASERAAARSEIAEYLDVNQQRRRLFPRAALVGLLAGLLAVGFRAMLAAGDALRNGLLGWAHRARSGAGCCRPPLECSARPFR